MKLFLQRSIGCLILLVSALCFQLTVSAQTATKSYPFAVGRTSSCGSSGTQEIHFYDYNSATNVISTITSNTATNPVGRYTPQLRIGNSGSSAQRFTSNYASISYNPKDHNIYYLWTTLSSFSGSGSVPRTYVWRWPVGTKPTSTSPKLDTLCSFQADLLGVAFDNDGNGYVIEFATNTDGVTQKAMLRSIDFATRRMGVADNLSLTGGAKIYTQGSGDVAMSPSGQMFFVVDNKLFTPNYKAYTGTGSNITTTYVDTVINSATGYFVGLTYANGETVSAYSGGGCPFYETNMLTASTSLITNSGTVYSASDMASVISGIGAAKKLVSVTPTGTAGQYDVIYDIFVKNYGNTDVTNMQITDDLTLINGAANVSNVTTSFVGAVPSGITRNTAFNGNSNKNLLNAGGTLPNYPVSSSSFTIRISCRLSNIETGKIYNNSAVATGIGFNNQNLMDVSTNGSHPDLNSNDKPDDEGENQPTPLLIAVTAQTPPCSILGQVFFSENFGTGGIATTLSTGTTQYTGSAAQPLGIDRYMLASNANMGDNNRFISLTDHTDGSGRMMIVNADATNKVFYSGEVGGLCANQQYSLSFYAAFIGNSNYQTVCDGFGGFKYPKVRMRVKDKVSGAIITEIATAEITATSWNQYGMKWVMPSGYSNIVFELVNDGEGGCGNDIAIDDIQFGTCDAAPTVNITIPSAGCLGSSTTFAATLSDNSVIPGAKEFQWQVSSDNITFTNIAGAVSETYTIANVTASDVNKYYRVLVAATGNIGSANCRYTSAGYLLSAKAPSVAPTGILKNKLVICPGDPIILKVNGGTLGTNANYVWYAGSCNGTPIGTGTTITVNPTVATTYYVRIEGDCNTTTCASIAITFNCDIDADKDGIPDIVESNNIDPKLDDDFDGIPNWRDVDYPGFIDINGDGVDDRFDADLDGVPNFLDRDSDNDGIPDVVEAGGADANGDGIIDNYTDTDNDGLSQNVDASNTGAAGSGIGLGLWDLDGDGIPNFLDLDSDNDGIPDVIEVFGVDNNNDGMLDFIGSFAANDTDGDGFLNSVDGDADGNGTIENINGPLLKTGPTSANGRASSYTYKNMDADSKPNPYDLDSDGDSIADVIEAGFSDANFNGQIDGPINSKGWNISVSSRITLNLPNNDGSGNPDFYDIDSDDDGIPDNVESQPTNIYTMPYGIDTDGDGIDDAYDAITGFGGKGINPVDTDGDTIPDYIDIDSDNDGTYDVYEGNDFNLNGKTDDDVALTGLDADGDGLDDKFDADNTGPRSTVLYMGNGGSLVGPAIYGSKAMVQKSSVGNYDRDWRYLGIVLNFSKLELNAKANENKVLISWNVKGTQNVAEFVIERSVDGNLFQPINKYLGKNTINEVEYYSITDDIGLVNATTIYYRIKQIEIDGKFMYSSIVSIKKKQNLQITLFPNPVSDQLTINIGSNNVQQYKVQITDVLGKVIYSSLKTVDQTGAEIKVDMQNLQSQLYILKVMSTSNEVLQTQKIIKR